MIIFSTSKIKTNFNYIIYFMTALICLMQTPLCFAKTIIITGQTVIDKPTTYKNVTFDLDHGYFLITNNATLSLENSTINGTLSSENPVFFQLTSGQLILKSSGLNVTVGDIEAVPLNPSQFNAINVVQGKVYLDGNRFDVDKPYTVGLLATGHFKTSNFIIQNNKIYNFHGGFFLSNSNNALIADNHFTRVSLSNILSKNGYNNKFRHNVILFSGNNGVDILDSDNVTLSDSYIFSSSCYSVFILRSHNVKVEHNAITGGKTYGIYIAPSIGLKGAYDKHLASVVDEVGQATTFKNSNIRIFANYIAQNRYGLAATNVDRLDVQNNIFIQRFSHNNQRKFWTNNDVLLSDTINIIWKANFYKEAFPQLIVDPLENSLKLVEFPLKGGVSL